MIAEIQAFVNFATIDAGDAPVQATSTVLLVPITSSNRPTKPPAQQIVQEGSIKVFRTQA
jgi:hypothetical protein